MSVCLSAAIYRKFQFNERKRRHFNFAHVLFKLRLEREEGATARLQRRRQRDQEQRSEQTKIRQAWLDRRSVCRAAEQPEARQARLERLRERNVKLCSMERTSFPSLASLACHA